MSVADRRRQPGVRQILFIHGGGAGAHDEWDDKLVTSLERELGSDCEVRYPRMPDEDDPSFDTRGTAIRCEVAALPDRAVVIGHSVGATLLVRALVDQPLLQYLGAIVLLSAPYVGAGGWRAEEFELPRDRGARLPQGPQVHVIHGLDDETVPPSHAALYARVIPQAQLHLLPRRNHQLNDDLGEVARLIALLPQRDADTHRSPR